MCALFFQFCLKRNYAPFELKAFETRPLRPLRISAETWYRTSVAYSRYAGTPLVPGLLFLGNRHPERVSLPVRSNAKDPAPSNGTQVSRATSKATPVHSNDGVAANRRRFLAEVAAAATAVAATEKAFWVASDNRAVQCTELPTLERLSSLASLRTSSCPVRKLQQQKQ